MWARAGSACLGEEKGEQALYGEAQREGKGEQGKMVSTEARAITVYIMCSRYIFKIIYYMSEPLTSN